MKVTEMTTVELLEHLGWSAGKLSKLMTGVRSTAPTEIGRLLGVLRVDPEVYTRVMAVANERDTGFVVRAHTDTWPDALVSVRLHESMALTIVTNSPVLVPALLQTSAYAASLWPDFVTRPRGVTERIRRSDAVFHRSSLPQMTHYVHEAVLHNVVGNRQVMAEQVSELVWHGNAVRVVPSSARTTTLHKTHFSYMTFPDSEIHKPVVHVDGGALSVLVDEPRTSAAYERVVTDLEEQALSPAETHQLFRDYLDRYYQEKPQIVIGHTGPIPEPHDHGAHP